jgi:hypothetical protein
MLFTISIVIMLQHRLQQNYVVELLAPRGGSGAAASSSPASVSELFTVSF